MRPVERGDWPEGSPGQKLDFSDYGKALTPLVGRIGGYCSYCGMRLDSSLHVEHVQPKKPGGVAHSDRERDWNNFLLACVNCNSTKGDVDIALDEVFWPDKDNTFRAFDYDAEGGIRVSSALVRPADRAKAERTLRLTGLDRFHGGRVAPQPNDRRWIGRKLAWGRARRALANLQRLDDVLMRDQIIETAIADGYWSIWYTVFKDDADIRRRLVEAAVGTAKSCFDADYLPVPRPGDAL